MKEYDIAFLHTAKIHVDTFTNLTSQMAPDLRQIRRVEPELLSKAVSEGLNHSVVANTEEILRDLASIARITISTCSTLGSIAEQLASREKLDVRRIDRAMADVAVGHQKILVLAALESTLPPTRQLLESSMRTQSSIVDIHYHLIEQAWEDFQSGDMPEYLTKIRNTIVDQQSGYDVIVLAQASMAGATNDLAAQIPVLSSPEIGVKAAVKTLLNL
ncbi:aspartate/glutamate racemase family protein [Vibrio nigripulchritudo]|uniref:aspartate/glutamate racemase family protein n=1 Tax=Vibrio nigripulchritudo TaxID=28173 RepID=UPI002491DC68|nr:aspartate/glutamate racemase family protein [Vibrio nigripulchritudo]BDU37597.1 hypothetical protein TUMSATVNIG2_20660 [Vibrio nigripulchritudo]BDU43317.1 hypothetical protein TUMSATVNIG3_21150 [Vibrio nigripulchritudo]